MRKLIYFIATTVDGFIAREDGRFDFFPTTGEHLPYLLSEYPETLPGHIRDSLGIQAENRHFDAVMMGRATFDVGTAEGITCPYPHLDQYLVSSTLTASPDPSVQLVREDPAALARDLKRQDGLDIWLCGGGVLASSLHAEIDEVVLKINPVALGTGRPLFDSLPEPLPLEQIKHRVFEGGVAIHRYRVRS